MRQIIELCNADLNKATFKNVLFFSVAEEGAMGEPGGVLFYVKSGELYHFNYVFGDVDLEKVKEFFPTIGKCKFGMFGLGSSVPQEWNYVNLGMGNHLIVRDEVFNWFLEDIGIDTPPSTIYRNWLEVADEILKDLQV